MPKKININNNLINQMIYKKINVNKIVYKWLFTTNFNSKNIKKSVSLPWVQKINSSLLLNEDKLTSW